MSSITKKTKKQKILRKSKKAPCEVCITRKISKKSGLYKLQNGDTHLRAFLPVDNTLRPHPLEKNIGLQLETVLLEGLKPNTKLFYFATNRKDFTDNISHFENAYDKLQNSGVVKTDSRGTVKVRVGCPQIYLAEDGNVYSRHFHIIYWQDNKSSKSSKSSKGIWDNKIYTHQIFCNVNKHFVMEMMQNPNVVIIDALNEDHYNQTHIPGAVNLPASHKWSLAEVMKRLPRGTTSTTPMIIYCYSPECTAAEKLWTQLNRLGFYNTMHYSGGISEWNAK